MNLELSALHLALMAASAGVGVIAGHVLAKRKLSQQLNETEQQNAVAQQQLQFNSQQLAQKEQQIEQFHVQHSQLQGELGQLRQQAEQLVELRAEKQQWQDKYQQAQQQHAELNSRYSAQQAAFEREKQSFDEKLQTLQDAESRLKEQFENLANKIFEQKTQKFSSESKEGLNLLLNPLKEQIEGFKKQVTDQYVKEGQERASLKTEILGLKELNLQITQEAAALTKALKGDNKQQGNWGELVLEQILNESGLRSGHEYHTQNQFKNEEGKAYKPDVIVHLPDNKDVIIDSKVSLTAYEKYFHEQDEVQRLQYLNEHILSLRSHIKELGKKDYQKLEGVKTLDYVLLFIPIEPAFLLAMDQAPDLMKLALDNNIMVVSPTNLLVALRTINNIWRYEHQNQNAQDIAKKAAALYDKFVGFTQDLEGLGTSLQTVQKRYDAAINKLSTGKGNIVRKVEEFKTLGVQTSKQLSSRLTQNTDED
ncbi:DNA recombination protein RmuC [Neptunicella marina]|uniref:DNA recombination protein RmuC n=1 Tax=Neptunicella marina TaxID=2125989 RepID=A0A8J6LV92_9ALTE|nr:DNA recombination protein RmuC [Neptunicella marina]MBC3764439.1 DNA recombination protein RmuC [Neptunicella marina]